MNTTLHILYLEDDPNDAELVRASILEGSSHPFQFTQVQDRESFETALQREPVDLVLADYAIPGFNGLAALEIVRKQKPDLPFIFVSGSMGEELAVETLRNGATDYVLKESLSRLGPAIRRALREARNRSERAAAELALRDSEQRLELALRGADLGLWDWNIKTGEVVFNERWANMLGYELEELEPSMQTWESLVHADDLDRFKSELAHHLEGTRPALESEYRLRSKQGEWRWVLNRGRVVQHDENGRAVRATGTHLDINTRKVAEDMNSMLEAQLRQAQKMEALGTLAGGIAHDFNNILGAIIGYSELVRSELDNKPDMQADIGEVLKAANRAKLLVQQILTFSRQQPQDLKPLRIAEAAQEAMNLLRATIPATVEVRINISPGTPAVLGDATQIHQIIMNLAANSVHAMPESGGLLEISISPVNVTEKMARTHADLKPGRYAKMIVSDNGHGMDATVQQRIFDPFFTTKAPGVGTGLGLAVVHGIMKKHSGAIKVSSKPGQGTQIELLFPASEQQEVNPGVDPQGFVQGGGRRVLFVDDEQSLAKVGRLMLERMGFSVDMFIASTEAWENFEKNPKRYDLVITDQTMPGMTGLELSGRILKLRPQLPIILVTGFHAAASPERIREIGLAEMLMKPYTIQSLSKAIRDVAGSAE